MLEVGDQQLFEQKVADFCKAGPENLHVLFDFDRTLTVSRSGKDDITTWHIIGAHLSGSGKDKFDELYKKYRALEIKGLMTEDDAVTWWTSVLDLFVENEINLFEIEEDFINKATIRPGAKELIDLCAESKIPIIVLSAGISDVIELWAKTYNMHIDIVLSTVLETDSTGKIIGWDKKSLIHVLNKQEMGHSELSKIIKTRQKTILIGDSLDDANMVKSEDNVIRIRVFDPRIDDKKGINQARQNTFKLFDAQIESGTLQPVVGLLNRILQI